MDRPDSVSTLKVSNQGDGSGTDPYDKERQGQKIVESYLETSRRNANANTTSKYNSTDKKLDEFGFIVNLDPHGELIHPEGQYVQIPGGAYTPPPGTEVPVPPTHGNTKKTRRDKRLKKKLLTRREKKWLDMLSNWDTIKKNKKKRTLMRKRVRKGIPNSIRGRGWARLAKVPEAMKKHDVGWYNTLVEESCLTNSEEKNTALVSSVPKPYDPSGVDAMKETIERDIGRTFPRHSMFYDSASDSTSSEGERTMDDSFDRLSLSGSMDEPHNATNKGMATKPSRDETEGSGANGEFEELYNHVELELSQSADTTSSSNGNGGGLGGGSDSHEPLVECWTKSVLVLEKATASASCPPRLPASHSSNPNLDEPAKKDGTLLELTSATKLTPRQRRKKQVDFTSAEGGQASLRRVLRAYNAYDPEVGYCQGMNFIAGMFITYMSEEEAYWLLVNIMNDAPCRMKGLFGEGMKEAHQVLYVAEKLIAQFNPKLSKHFDKEGIHITMFATQWLLTMYTSSFPFHFVTRVWDCFLSEGWKVAYRVMLALLERASPILMKLRFEDILEYFKELPTFVDGDTVLEHAFKIPLKKKHIEKYAKEWEAKS